MKSISTQLYLSACGAMVLLSSSVQAQPPAAPAPAAAAAPAPLAPDAIWAREQDPGYLPKKAIVTFNPPVTGAISFTQENWQAPVNIEVDLQNIPAVPAAWHVHRLPAKNGCCECTAGHYNPHNATTGYTSCPDPRDCEVGDLATKFGQLQTPEVKAWHQDPFLTLYGFNSIMGRSVVLHGPAGNRIACGTVQLAHVQRVAAKAVLTGNVNGTVWFVQQVDSHISDTKIMVEATSARLVPFVPPTPLQLPNGTIIDPATNLTTAMRLPQHANMSRAQIFINDVALGPDKNCDTPPAFNPTGAGECTMDNNSPYSPCMLGDVHGRHIPFFLPAVGNDRVFVTDYLPLSGPHSIVNRSLSIFLDDGTSSCADILAVPFDQTPFA